MAPKCFTRSLENLIIQYEGTVASATCGSKIDNCGAVRGTELQLSVAAVLDDKEMCAGCVHVCLYVTVARRDIQGPYLICRVLT